MDINDKIAANVGLIYSQLKRFELTQDQDAESFAYEALYRAVITYDENAGAVFSTYAVCVISNALRKHLRTLNKKRQLDVVSYFTPLSADEDSGYLLDTIHYAEDTESVVFKHYLQDATNKAFDEVYEASSDLHKRIVDMFYRSDEPMTQQNIAAAAGVTQATVSKVISSFKHKLHLRLEEYL